MNLDLPAEDDIERERIAFDVDRPDFDLLRAAALLPRVEGREPDVESVVATVQGWSEEVRVEVERRTSWQGPLHGLVSVLFSRVGLRGDTEEYDAPSNSFLEDVIARRRGLPISLSLLVVETARRAGLVACGLALPRHFMAGIMLRRPVPDASEPLMGDDGAILDDDGDRAFADLFFVDAFHAQVLPPEDVAARAGLPLEELGEYLTPAAPDVILTRLLTNLRGTYLRRQDVTSCLRVLSRLLLLKPREAALHLERAHLKNAIGDAHGALADAEHGMKLAKDPDEREAAERILEKLMKSSGWVQ